MIKNHFFSLALLLLLFSCSNENESSSEEVSISISATNFLNEVINIMETNSLNRNSIDWSDFRSQVFETAGAAQSVNDVYESGAMLKALALLGDNHSSITTENDEYISTSTAICPISDISPPNLEDIPENIGYVFITGFNSSVEAEAIAFAEKLREVIQEKDAPELIGWIVDLRVNTGGNMYPMLAGIGPILGEGIAGYFSDAEGDDVSWSYAQGKAMIGQRTVTQIQNPYTLFNENPKVAVLLDVATASSGEAIAISFKNRANTSSFGSPTCGLSTGNSAFTLSDNSILALTTTIMSDRAKNVYGRKIEPDFPVANNEIIIRAIEYIQNN